MEGGWGRGSQFTAQTEHVLRDKFVIPKPPLGVGELRVGPSRPWGDEKGSDFRF